MPLVSVPSTCRLIPPQAHSQQAQADSAQLVIGSLVAVVADGVWRCLMLVAFSAIAVSGCFAQSPCSMKPGQHLVTVPLQNAPNAFEPACQPARIRVNDRQQVIIRLTGLSPVDVCTASSKPPTATTVANPLETIINTVAGLKSFDFETANTTTFSDQNIASMQKLFRYQIAAPGPRETPEEKKKREELEAAKKADDDALQLFITLSKEVLPAARDVYSKQTKWLTAYQTDIKIMAAYLAQDYRGTKYVSFLPETDPNLATTRQHLAFPKATYPAGPDDIPSELDYAPLQALADEMKSLETRLITSCTTAGKTCDQNALETTGRLVDSANAFLSVAQDNLKTLQTDQAAVVTSYTALDKVYLDFQQRLSQGTLQVGNNTLIQDIHLPPDYGATDTGSISCVSDALATQATTDSINYSILYQNIPIFTVSAGLLITFQEKREIGTQPAPVNGTSNTYFTVTDSARAQVFPMAFTNFRIAPPILKTYFGQHENELVITHNASAGIGVNSNTGTNQPEFFAGYALGLNRVYIHLGAHFGRTESLGGGYALNTIVPTGFTGAAPINWSYHPAFSIGLSVRLAPF